MAKTCACACAAEAPSSEAERMGRLEEVLAHPAKPLQEILPPVPHRPMVVRPSQRLLAMLGILKAG